MKTMACKTAHRQEHGGNKEPYRMVRLGGVDWVLHVYERRGEREDKGQGGDQGKFNVPC